MKSCVSFGYQFLVILKSNLQVYFPFLSWILFHGVINLLLISTATIFQYYYFYVSFYIRRIFLIYDLIKYWKSLQRFCYTHQLFYCYTVPGMSDCKFTTTTVIGLPWYLMFYIWLLCFLDTISCWKHLNLEMRPLMFLVLMPKFQNTDLMDNSSFMIDMIYN